MRIELGVHIDGYLAQAGKTVVVGQDPDEKQSDLLVCLDTCIQAALRMIKPGKEAIKYQETLEKICGDFGIGLTES